jgi:hypothetical protein
LTIEGWSGDWWLAIVIHDLSIVIGDSRQSSMQSSMQSSIDNRIANRQSVDRQSTVANSIFNRQSPLANDD